MDLPGRTFEASTSQLAPQRQGVLAALRQPRPEIVQMRLQNGRAGSSHGTLGEIGRVREPCAPPGAPVSSPGRLPAATRPGRGGYVPLHGRPAKRARLSALAVRSAAVRRYACVRLAVKAAWALGIVSNFLKLRTHPVQPALQHLPGVVQQVPAVGHLCRPGRCHRDAAGVFGRANRAPPP